jgi:hypothetical protein
VFDKIDLDHFKSIETRPLLELLKQTYFEQYARDKNLFKKRDRVFSAECLPPVYVAYAMLLVNAEIRTLSELRECDTPELVDLGIPLGHAKRLTRFVRAWEQKTASETVSTIANYKAPEATDDVQVEQKIASETVSTIPNYKAPEAADDVLVEHFP